MSEERVFTNSTHLEMLNFLRKRENNTERIISKVNQTYVGGLEAQGPLGALDVQSEFGWEHKACEEVVNGLKLYLAIEGNKYPIRDIAWKSLCERADLISRRLYTEFTAVEKAEILNKFFKKAPNGGQAIVVDGMVSAYLSSSYVPCPIPDLLECLEDELNHRFSEWELKEGNVNHSYTTTVYTFPKEAEELLKVYQEALKRKNLPCTDVYPGIRFTSSDVGLSAINVDMVVVDGSRIYHLGRSFAIFHIFENVMEKFRKNLPEVFAQYKNIAEKLAKLLSVEINFPETTFMAAAKAVGITKNWAHEAYPIFEAQRQSIGEEYITAHDIFIALSEVPRLAKDKVSLDRILALEEAVGKILDLNWSKLDTGTPVQWRE